MEETVYDNGKLKVVSKVKKYATKIVEKFIPGAGVVEEICEDVYNVYSDEKDSEKYNDTIEKIKNDLNEQRRVEDRIVIETTPEKLRADLERAEEEQRNSQKDVS